jgi:hypothetical protein
MKEVIVTDHALVRYLERVLEIDVERIRADIAAECSSAVNVGAKRLRRGPLVYRFDGAKLITICTRGTAK